MNEFLTADCSCTTKYFWSNPYRSLYSTSLRFFWHILCPNWSTIRDSVRLQTFRRIWNWSHFPLKTAILSFSYNFQRLTLPRIIDQFRRKMCQKKRKDVSYQLLWEFFQKYFVLHELSAVKNLFSTGWGFENFLLLWSFITFKPI